MTRQDSERFAAVLERLRLVFPSELDERFAETYFAVLQDLSIDLLESGALRLLRDARDGDFFPKPGDLRAAAEAASRDRAVKQLPAPDYLYWRERYLAAPTQPPRGAGVQPMPREMTDEEWDRERRRKLAMARPVHTSASETVDDFPVLTDAVAGDPPA